MSNSTTSDRELQEFLERAPSSLLFELTKILGDRLGCNGLRRRYACEEHIPVAGAARSALAEELTKEVGYFGSHNLAYLARRAAGKAGGAPYHQIVRDVANALNAASAPRLKLPRVASIAERERLICEKLLGMAIRGRPVSDIEKMLREAGLSAEAAARAAKNIAAQGVAGGLTVLLVNLIGKKTVTHLVQGIVAKVLATQVTRETAQKATVAIAKKVPQKAVARLVAGVGWALLAKDLFDLCGPATRVTIPAVALIAAGRIGDALQV